MNVGDCVKLCSCYHEGLKLAVWSFGVVYEALVLIVCRLKWYTKLGSWPKLLPIWRMLITYHSNQLFGNRKSNARKQPSPRPYHPPPSFRVHPCPGAVTLEVSLSSSGPMPTWPRSAMQMSSWLLVLCHLLAVTCTLPSHDALLPHFFGSLKPSN